jgi:hypothetical protein
MVSSLFLMPKELAVIKRLLDFSFKLNINLCCVLCENHFYCEGTSVIIFFTHEFINLTFSANLKMNL